MAFCCCVFCVLHEGAATRRSTLQGHQRGHCVAVSSVFFTKELLRAEVRRNGAANEARLGATEAAVGQALRALLVQYFKFRKIP